MTSVTVPMKAQFYDVDSMSIVWHGNYVRFFEQARCDLLDKIGYNYLEMEASGFAWPIVDLQVKYVRPIRFGQEFFVKATIVETSNRLKISYLVLDRVSGETLTKGSTTQVAINVATGELCLESPSVLTDKVMIAS